MHSGSIKTKLGGEKKNTLLELIANYKHYNQGDSFSEVVVFNRGHNNGSQNYAIHLAAMFDGLKCY